MEYRKLEKTGIEVSEIGFAAWVLVEAGATWRIESMWDVLGGLDAVIERIKQGPPRIKP